MNPGLPWNPLIETAQSRLDDAARQLAHAIQKHTAAQQQLEILTQYREEYQNRLAHTSQSGLSVMQLNNHREFIARLDQAIIQQRTAVQMAHSEVCQSQSVWQGCHRTLKSFDTLASREQHRQQQQQARHEQKQLDEHASHLYRASHPKLG